MKQFFLITYPIDIDVTNDVHLIHNMQLNLKLNIFLLHFSIFYVYVTWKMPITIFYISRLTLYTKYHD